MKIENIAASQFQFPIGKSGSLFGSNWNVAFSNDNRLRVLKVSEDGGQAIAACFVWDTQKRFFRSLITPPLMPNTGWVWLTDFEKPSTRISKEKEVLSALLDFLNSGNWSFWKLDFPSDFKDFQSAIWKGIVPKQKYTYRLELKSDWLDHVDSKLKNILKKKETFHFEKRSFSSEEFLDFQETLSSKGVRHVELLQSICASGTGTDSFFTVVGDGGKYKALCLNMNDVVYYLAATNAKENNALSACGLAHCIDLAEEQGVKVFDFEGSMIPEVERFFRGFGGELTPYFSIENGHGFIYSLRRILNK